MSTGEKVRVVFGFLDTKEGEIVEKYPLSERVKIRLHPWGEVIECEPADEENTFRPIKPPRRFPARPRLESDNEVLDMIIGVFCLMIWVVMIGWAIIAGFFRLTSRAVSQKTGDRFLVFYAAMAITIALMVNSLSEIGQWGTMSFILRLWLILQFLLWLGGAYLMISRFTRRLYPFDRSSLEAPGLGISSEEVSDSRF